MLDVPIALLPNDDQGIIILRVDVEGVLLGEYDIVPCFPYGDFGEARGYYIRCKHLPNAFSPKRYKVNSTGENSEEISDNSVCVISNCFWP